MVMPSWGVMDYLISNLCNKKLDRVPKAIGKLDCVIHLQLRGNKLKDLPLELSHLYQVRYKIIHDSP